MAKPDPDHKQRMEEAAQEAAHRVEQAAEQTTHAAEAGQEVARASADMLKQNVETLQTTWRSGLEAATSVMGRSGEQFGRTLGLSGEDAEKSKRATEHSARNAQALLYSGTGAAKVMGGISQEYFQMVQHQAERSLEHINRLLTCRTPQDFVAAQSDIVRETVETSLESSRRMADMSLKMADETEKQMKQTMEQMRRGP
ncbi:TIGR01841 family phasin [Bradyrhizobium sp. SYSU BS000235]|uniref:TIGR01841 family phasin n=1 Tax=Bradyrhizobium sp. SYSU BS000235 TaxID=3411332 RepID=UPI003C775D67